MCDLECPFLSDVRIAARCFTDLIEGKFSNLPRIRMFYCSPTSLCASRVLAVRRERVITFLRRNWLWNLFEDTSDHIFDYSNGRFAGMTIKRYFVCEIQNPF